MNRILAVSPHLDDAVFSAGGTLAAHVMAGDTVRVVTCFTGNVEHPAGFALACQLDKGLGAEIDYMALRRKEDIAACGAIGAEAVHWPFLEAPHRGYDNARALFQTPLLHDDVADDIANALEAQIAAFAPDRIYGPFGVGRHVDHIAVRRAMEVCGYKGHVLLWEDYPYAMRETVPPPSIVRRTLAPESFASKRNATLAYTSQLGFQFGGDAEARAALCDWRVEGFAPLRRENAANHSQ
ncbi:MAG: PIG-L family deacetylase [Pontixanthobacter sp.]